MNSTSSATATAETTGSYRDLPFIVDGKWAPGTSGSYTGDCALGVAHAQLMLDLIQDTQSPAIYGAVARSITLAGTFGPVEIGFASRLAELML